MIPPNISRSVTLVGNRDTLSSKEQIPVVPIAKKVLDSASSNEEAASYMEEHSATLLKQGDKKLAKLAAISQTINDLKQLQEILPDLQIPENLLSQLETLKASFETSKAQYLEAKNEIAQAIGSWEAQRGLKTNIDIDTETVDSKEYGFKFSRLIEQINFLSEAQLPGVEVPKPKGISNSELHTFLNEATEIETIWQNLNAKFEKFKSSKEFGSADSNFLQQPDVIEDLRKIQSQIADAFEPAASTSDVNHKFKLGETIETWLQKLKEKNSYLMVRSSGAEDSRATANAGGNLSISYVDPEPNPVYRAIGEVVASYYGNASLQNRLNADENPFATKQHLAVCLQELIGETPLTFDSISKVNPEDIPISLVLFSNEPTYVGNEPFRIMRLSATYGHGEGVVGAVGVRSDTFTLLRSVKHPERLYIIEEINGKPQRLAPVIDSKTGEIKLQKVNNPETIATSPALNKRVLTQLFYLGVAIEKVYKHPMDMELVIKNGEIYPVQARPVNRPSSEPTYLDLKKVEAAASRNSSSEIMRFDTETFLPGRAQAQIITSPKEILIIETLEAAEKAYKKGKHKLIIIRQEEPANSHPVVNFSGMGIPVFYSDQLEEIKNFVSKTAKKTPLIACVQTGKLTICPDGLSQKVDEFISSGYTVHPARLAISTSNRKKLSTEASQGINVLPDEIRNALMQLRALESSETALAAVKQLKHSLPAAMEEKKERLYEKVSNDPSLPYAHELIAGIQAWKKFSKGALSELKKSLKKDDDRRLETLWHAKIVELLILQDPGQNSVGRLSLANIDIELEAVDKIARYRAQFSNPEKTLFSELLLDGNATFTPEHEQSWTTFLTALETAYQKHQIDNAEVSNLKAMLHQMREVKILPLWMARFFLPAAQKLQEKLSEPAAATQLLRDLCAEHPTDNTFLLKIRELNEEIASLEENNADFANDDGFKRSWTQLKKMSENFLSLDQLLEDGDPLTKTKAAMGQSPWQKQLVAATSLEKIAAYQLMEKFVTLYDHSIKAIKGSQQYNEEEKVALFKKMLPGYFTLLCEWQLNLAGSKIEYHWNWPLETYLEKMQECFEKAPTSSDTLNPSRAFNVSAAKLGPKTAFDRSLPETLEDFFTLTHQNLITAVQVLLSSEMDGKAELPEAMARTAEQFTLAFDPINPVAQLSGYHLSDEGIELHYNYPLRNHSASFVLKFEKKSQKCTCDVEFLGENRDRWNMIGNQALLYDSFGIVKLAKAPDIQPMSLKYSFDMSDPEKSACAASLLRIGANLTFERPISENFTEPKLLTKLTDTANDEQFRLIRNHFKGANNLQLPKDFPKELIYKTFPIDFWPDDFTEQIKKDKAILEDFVKVAALIVIKFYLKTVPSEMIDENIALLAVTTNGMVLEFLPEPWKSSPKIILAALQQNAFALKHAGEFQKDREIVLAAIRKNGFALEYAKEFQDDYKIVYTAVKNFPTALQFAGPEARKNKKIVLAAVKKNGNSLEYAKEFQDDFEVVYAAVKNSPYALKFAGQEARKDKKIVLEAVKKNGDLCREADSSFKTDREIALAATKTAPLQLFWFDEKLQNDQKLVLSILSEKNTASFRRFADQILSKTKLFNNRKVIMAIADLNLLSDFPEAFKNDRKMVLALIDRFPYIFSEVSAELQRDPEIVLKAVQKDGYVLKFAPELNNNPAIVRAAVANRGDALQFASDELRDDIETVLIAIKQSGDAYAYAGPIASKNERILFEVSKTRPSLILPLYEKHSIDDRKLLINIAYGVPSKLSEYAKKELLYDREFIKEVVISIVEKHKDLFEHISAGLTEIIPDSLMNDYDYILSLVKAYPIIFKELVQYHGDREMALIAIEQDANAMSVVDPKLKNEEQFLKEAIARNSLVLKDAVSLQGDREIVLGAITQNAQGFQFASDSLKMDRDFILNAVKLNPKALELAPKHFLADIEIVRTAVERDSSLWSAVSNQMYLISEENTYSLFHLYSELSEGKQK